MSVETNDRFIDIEKIMMNIRKRAKNKKEVRNDNEEDMDADLAPFSYIQPEENIENYMESLIEIWDAREDCIIKSHRPILGQIVVFAKKIIRKILKLFLINNILLSRQAEFNLKLIKFLEASLDYNRELFKELSRDFTNKTTALSDKITNETTVLSDKITNKTTILTDKTTMLSDKIIEQRQDFILLKQRLERMLDKIGTKHNLSRETEAELFHEKKNLMDHNYFLFENKFRGRQKEIKGRQEVYLPLFKDTNNVLDIGCGRGEFLETLKEVGIEAKGIDLNEDMIYICKEKKLNVQQVDTMTYLNSIEDDSLGGIFASHIVEHFEREALIEFVKTCVRKLSKGSRIVLETPNPLSIIVSAINFYLDLSHIKPIHPEALKFLLEENGFSLVEIKYLSPYPDEAKLQTITYKKHEESEKPEESSKAIPVELMNNNIEKLNKLLFGYQDYAVIGKKP